MDTVVLKFGGSSLANNERLMMVANKIIEKAMKHKVVVVVSAQGKTTDNLLKQAKELEEITGVKPRKIKGIYVTEALKDKGFTHIILTNKKIDSKYKYNFMQITIIMNPLKLLEVSKLELLKEDQVEELNDRFYSEM